MPILNKRVLCTYIVIPDIPPQIGRRAEEGMNMLGAEVGKPVSRLWCAVNGIWPGASMTRTSADTVSSLSCKETHPRLRVNGAKSLESWKAVKEIRSSSSRNADDVADGSIREFYMRIGPVPPIENHLPVNCRARNQPQVHSGIPGSLASTSSGTAKYLVFDSRSLLPIRIESRLGPRPASRVVVPGGWSRRVATDVGDQMQRGCGLRINREQGSHNPRLEPSTPRACLARLGSQPPLQVMTACDHMRRADRCRCLGRHPTGLNGRPGYFGLGCAVLHPMDTTTIAQELVRTPLAGIGGSELRTALHRLVVSRGRRDTIRVKC
ncbi:hypothetical protein B0T17DRAFT_502867 [Bombardia bombarda]|uniref:Uncharacterized protein n=1 Tax=Bombardia bombarda TaxID=252184 RepID=A0AA40CEH4_9PEZI|nr:hypothetical protein B0T17DRAFT_502867 [Bombardia bombarda]